MVSERLRRRLELRRSNAATRRRNRYREHKTGQDKPTFEQALDEYIATRELSDPPPS